MDKRTKIKLSKLPLSITIIGLFTLMLSSCIAHTNKPTQQVNKDTIQKKSNPVVYFEIPVIDMERATRFYSTVFDFKFDTTIIDNNEMALFPFTEENSGISGALAKGIIYKPTKDGVLIYFNTANMDETLRLANTNGGKILYPKTDNGIGLIAEFEDTEGNRIALYQSKE
jgi:predicted enzyme related to lactoylglutathione lyase